jgi:preprotein translocase subunit SecE
METKVEEQPTIVDTAKLVFAIVVVLAGLVGYYYFADASALLRALAVIVALGVAAAVAFTSLQGRTLWKFIQGARVELNKVVWPTREETIQTTLVVLVVAFRRRVLLAARSVFVVADDADHGTRELVGVWPSSGTSFTRIRTSSTRSRSR